MRAHARVIGLNVEESNAIDSSARDKDRNELQADVKNNSNELNAMYSKTINVLIAQVKHLTQLICSIITTSMQMRNQKHKH